MGLLSLKQAIKLGVGVFLVAAIIGLAYFTREVVVYLSMGFGNPYVLHKILLLSQGI
jgi:hypothetical protein